MLGGLLFQFHKGTIKTTKTFLVIIRLRNFNSIKVQLKLNLLDMRFSNLPYFNSIKVQLKHFAVADNNAADTISIP